MPSDPRVAMQLPCLEQGGWPLDLTSALPLSKGESDSCLLASVSSSLKRAGGPHAASP